MAFCVWFFFIWFSVSVFSLFGFLGGSAGKTPPSVRELQETQVQSLGQEDPLEEEIATHSSIFPSRIPWTEEPSGLKSMGS